jgi:hypothetical protein
MQVGNELYAPEALPVDRDGVNVAAIRKMLSFVGETNHSRKVVTSQKSIRRATESRRCEFEK